MNVGEAVVTITGDTRKLDQSLKNSQSKVKASADKMRKALLPVGLALTAVGVAGLKLVDSARKMNAQLGVTALNLGITTREMRNLALSTTNVTFPLKEVIATFDFLARAGIKDTEVLKDTATAFDTLGDAIGLGASKVTEIMVPAMKTFRLSAEEIASKIDMMTSVVRNSTISLDDFNTMVGYTDQEMVDAGFTIEDMAAAMIYMSDNGVEPGRVMLREWMKAVTRSKEEGIAMTEALGMTSEELEKYKDKLAGSTGMAQEYADMMNKQLGIMDKLRQKWSELTLQYGTFLQPLEPILATMTALGPIMMIFSTVVLPSLTFATVAAKIKLIALAIATKAVTAAQWLWNAAMTANPIGIMIVAIGALIAASVLIWRNWDKVGYYFKQLWSNIKIYFLQGVENILMSLEKFTSFIPWLGEKVKEAREAISNMIEVEKVKKDWRETKKAIGETTEKIEELTEVLVGDDGLIEAQVLEREELEEQNEALGKHQEALEAEQRVLEGTIDKFAAWRREMEYDRSEAGKLNITMKDIYSALFDMERPLDEIREDFGIWGDDIGNVNGALEYLVKQGYDVIAYLELQEGAINKVSDAYRGMGTAATGAAGASDGGGTGTGPFTGEPTGPPPPTLSDEQWYAKRLAEFESGRVNRVREAFAQGKNLGEILLLMTQGMGYGMEYQPFLQGTTTWAGLSRKLSRGYATPEQMAPIIEKDWKTPLANILGFLPEFTHGGIAMRPMLASIADREPEAVIPLSKLGNMLGGYKTANIYVMLDEGVLARAVEVRLVDDLRLKTGVKM